LEILGIPGPHGGSYGRLYYKSGFIGMGPSWPAASAGAGKRRAITILLLIQRRKIGMAIQISEELGSNMVTIHCSGKVKHGDYQTFVPEFELLVKKYGKLRIFFDLTGFEGWEPSALWDEIKFDVKHFPDIERIATVGDNKWEEFLAMLFKPFIAAKTRYFDSAQIDEAKSWILEG
jgi:hypothetical protein